MPDSYDFIRKSNYQVSVSYSSIAVFGKDQDFERKNKLINIELVCSGLSS
jgi:hypothetical protein